MRKIIIILILLFSSIVMAGTPFAIQAARRLAIYASENGYTENQIRNAPPAVVLSHLGIDPDSEQAKKYIFLETVIKGHAINYLYPKELTLKQKVLMAIRENYPNATLTVNPTDATQYIIDLDGE
jgi:hypothetical protein